MTAPGSTIEWILGFILILSSIGVILLKKPVHASLSFLMTLMSLAALYLELSAQFIAVIQVLVYAGAILVIFMFVIILFQDAYLKIEQYKSNSSPVLLYTAGITFLLALIFMARHISGISLAKEALPDAYGTVQSIGYALNVDYFFPFEVVTLLFLIAAVGALYIGKKET